MTSNKTALRRVLAGTGALALTFAGMFAGASAASAAVGPDQPDAPEAGSLTIHKRQGVAQDQDTPPTGEELEVAPGQPLADVQFTTWQLGAMVEDACVAIDLTNAADWEHVPTGTAPATLDGVKAAGFCILDPQAGVSQTTGEDGTTTFDDLALGLYYVQETDAPANTISRSAPFYVTIPLPSAGDWIYNVHVYPKNQLMDPPTKTIKDQPSALVIGSRVTWTIEQTIPTLNVGEHFDVVQIYDVLDPRLNYYSSTLRIGNSSLGQGTHYSVQPPIPTTDVTWTFTKLGREFLERRQGQTLTIELTTTVLEVGDGIILNDDYGSIFNTVTQPGITTPVTYWGQLVVKKVDQDQMPLAGARFEVYPRSGTACPADTPETGLVSSGVSDKEGVVLWTPNRPANSSPLGLWILNANTPQDPKPSKFYCVYETEAPSGYTGQGVHTAEIKPGEAAVHTWVAVNTQKEGPDLPLTGATGTAAMGVGGLLLVGAGGAALAAASRRRRINA